MVGLKKNYAMPLVFLAAVSLSKSTAIVKLKCSNIDEFYYAHPGSHCTGYYRCTSRGKFDSGECDPGSMFDFYSQTCSRNSGVCYEPICTGRTNGVYQDTSHACRRSFTCLGGRVIALDNCPSGQLHNGIKCVEQDLVMCELPHTTAIAYPYDGDKRCVGKADSYYSVDDCNNYLICKNQEVVSLQQCPQNYLFNDATKECVIRSELPYCPYGTDDNVCRAKRNGHYPDPSSNDCSDYIVCKEGQYIAKNKCSQQAVFDGDNCVPAPLYTCPGAVWAPENDICKKKSNGFYSNPQQSCSSYVRCMSERTVEIFECPKSQYFDPDERNCVYEKFPERKKCKDPIKSSDCNHKSRGYYQTGDCQDYYFCQNGIRTEFKCSLNKVFNGETCISKSRYKCPLSDDNSCDGKQDSYYKDKDGCRGYFYCSSGHKISYLCEEGHIFDGNQCVRVSSEHVCKTKSICLGKSDGYHADLRSNCRNYFYCLNGEKVTELTCRGSRLFNGGKCVENSEYSCPSQPNHKELNCVPKSCSRQCKADGFYQDIESDCRNYFFCISGKLSELSCPNGQLFDGELCVVADKYNCPVYCASNQNCPLSGL